MDPDMQVEILGLEAALKQHSGGSSQGAPVAVPPKAAPPPGFGNPPRPPSPGPGFDGPAFPGVGPGFGGGRGKQGNNGAKNQAPKQRGGPMAAGAMRGGMPKGMSMGLGGDDHWLYYVSRGVSGVGAAAGYLIAGTLQAFLWQRILPADLIGVGFSFVVSFLMTVIVNIMQTSYRNTTTSGNHMTAWAIAAYAADFLLTFFSVIAKRGLDVGWVPLGSHSIPMTWVDWLLLLFFSSVLTFTLEPLIEYAITGEMYIFGKRFGM